jgi:hypothetical protein
MEKIHWIEQVKKMKWYKQSRRKGTSYIQYDEGTLTGLVTSCVEAAFYTMVFKERDKGREIRGSRCKQLLDNVKETRNYGQLKEAALDRTLLRTRSFRGCGRTVKKTA